MSEDVYEMLDSYQNQQKKVSFQPPKFGKKKENLPQVREEERKEVVHESTISGESSKEKSIRNSFPLDNLFSQIQNDQSNQPGLFEDQEFHEFGNVDELNLEFQEGFQERVKEDEEMGESEGHDNQWEQSQSVGRREEEDGKNGIAEIVEISQEDEEHLQQMQESIHELSHILMAEKENSPHPGQKKAFLSRPKKKEYSYQSPKSRGVGSSRNESSSKRKDEVPVLEVEVAGGRRGKVVLSLGSGATGKTLRRLIREQVGECQVEKVAGKCMAEISRFASKLGAYLEAKQLKDVRSYRFQQYARDNPHFLAHLCADSLQSQSQAAFHRDKSAPSIKRANATSHHRNNTQMDIFNASVSPNCSKQLKVSSLMNEPPNISTWKESNVQAIKVVSHSLKSNVLTLEMEYGIGQKGKMQLNVRKLDDEMKTKVLQSQLIKIPAKQKKTYFESKEILSQIDKFCIRHKLDNKQKAKMAQVLTYDNIQPYIKKD